MTRETVGPIAVHNERGFVFVQMDNGFVMVEAALTATGARRIAEILQGHAEAVDAQREDPPNQKTGEVFYCRNCGKLIGGKFWLCPGCRRKQGESGRDYRPTGPVE